MVGHEAATSRSKLVSDRVTELYQHLMVNTCKPYFSCNSDRKTKFDFESYADAVMCRMSQNCGSK